MASNILREWTEASLPLVDSTIKDDISRNKTEEKTPTTLAEDIQQDKLQIGALLHDISSHINNDDYTQVSRALALLQESLRGHSKITRQDLHLLINYFVTRLKNEEHQHLNDAGIDEIILLFLNFAQHGDLEPGDAPLVLTGLFSLADNRTRLKELPGPIRQNVYTVVDNFCREYPQKITEELGYDKIIAGLLNLVIFEKKASCLLIIFQLISYVSRNWKLSSANMEDLFNSFVRYFPIKVGGAQDEATRLSIEMRRCLSDCMTSNDFYASLVFPHLIQRLDDRSSISASSMHEVLAAIEECLTKYTVPTITVWASKIWDAIKFEIWNGENEDNIKKSLEILRSIAVSLESGHSSSPEEDSYLVQYVTKIATESRERIVDSPKDYLPSTGRILYVIASTSNHTFQLVSAAVIPCLLELWQRITLASEKKMLLNIINNILRARIELLDMGNKPNRTGIMKSFTMFQEELVEIFSNAIFEIKRIAPAASGTNSNFGNNVLCYLPALDGLTMLFKAPSYLSSVEQGMIVQELIQITTVIFPRKGTVHDEALKAIQKISSYQPTVFANMIIPTLMDKIPEFLPTDARTQTKGVQLVASFLNDIADISCLPCLQELETGFPEGSYSHYWHRNFDLFAKKLLNKLDAVLSTKGQNYFATIIIAAILKGLRLFDCSLGPTQLEAVSPDPHILPYEFIWNHLLEESLPLDCLSLCGVDSQDWLCQKASTKRTQNHENFLHLVGCIFLLISRSKLNTPENNIVYKFNKTSTILGFVEEFQSPTLYSESQPLTGPESSHQVMINMALIYSFIGIRPDPDDDMYLTNTKSRLGISNKVGHMAASAIYRIAKIESAASSCIRIAMLYYAQILIAKFHCSRDKLPDGKTVLDVIKLLVSTSQNESLTYTMRVYQIIVYLAAASFACYDRQTMEPLFDILCKGLSPSHNNPQVCALVAKSFRMILADSFILNENNYIKIRPLRKGLLLELIKPLIIQHHIDSQLMPQSPSHHNRIQEHYLVAIIGILGHIEHQLILDNFEINDLISLVLDGTNVPNDDWAKAEYIKLMHMLVLNRPEIMQLHIDSVIERMIERTHNTLEAPSDGNVECRILALKVLHALIEKFGQSLLLQRRTHLIAELAVAKDDCHADVRYLASQCSLAWIYAKS